MNRTRQFLEDWLCPLCLGALLWLIGCLGAGCRTASPERQAFRATDTVITTANAAMDVWFAHVRQEEAALERLKTANPGEFMARRRALILAEGKVASAWDTYVTAQKAVILGAAALGPGESPPPTDVETLKREVITLVQSLIR